MKAVVRHAIVAWAFVLGTQAIQDTSSFRKSAGRMQKNFVKHLSKTRCFGFSIPDDKINNEMEGHRWKKKWDRVKEERKKQGTAPTYDFVSAFTDGLRRSITLFSDEQVTRVFRAAISPAKDVLKKERKSFENLDVEEFRSSVENIVSHNPTKPEVAALKQIWNRVDDALDGFHVWADSVSYGDHFHGHGLRKYPLSSYIEQFLSERQMKQLETKILKILPKLLAKIYLGMDNQQATSLAEMRVIAADAIVGSKGSKRIKNIIQSGKETYYLNGLLQFALMQAKSMSTFPEWTQTTAYESMTDSQKREVIEQAINDRLRPWINSGMVTEDKIQSLLQNEPELQPIVSELLAYNAKPAQSDGEDKKRLAEDRQRKELIKLSKDLQISIDRDLPLDELKAAIDRARHDAADFVYGDVEPVQTIHELETHLRKDRSTWERNEEQLLRNIDPQLSQEKQKAQKFFAGKRKEFDNLSTQDKIDFVKLAEHVGNAGEIKKAVARTLNDMDKTFRRLSIQHLREYVKLAKRAGDDVRAKKGREQILRIMDKRFADLSIKELRDYETLAMHASHEIKTQKAREQILKKMDENFDDLPWPDLRTYEKLARQCHDVPKADNARNRYLQGLDRSFESLSFNELRHHAELARQLDDGSTKEKVVNRIERINLYKKYLQLNDLKLDQLKDLLKLAEKYGNVDTERIRHRIKMKEIYQQRQKKK